MSERYLVMGTQLGMLLALEDKTERKKLIDEIIDKQFVGNSELDIKTDVKNTILKKPLIIQFHLSDFENKEIDNE